MRSGLIERAIEARKFEQDLPREKRKALGQFFTGIQLARVLAELASDKKTKTVLDPMAGHGDLLDAAREAIEAGGGCAEALHGVEVDPATAIFCKDRLGNEPTVGIWSSSAFAPALSGELLGSGYDLVISNPPYVRYQQATGPTLKVSPRRGLLAAVERRVAGEEQLVWRTLALEYSGLADLSVPSWLFGALLVRPGGRLGIVAPATWRSREYADVVRYLLLRCFVVEFVVEDTQPGWFSDAQVRTHLIVARRLSGQEIAVPVSERSELGRAKWARISPAAAANESLVGQAFDDMEPELAFAEWLRNGCPDRREGIHVEDFDLDAEWRRVALKLRSRAWFEGLEPNNSPRRSLLRGGQDQRGGQAMPDVIARALPCDVIKTVTLDELGIRAGQGLRTGYNPFFYVEAVGPETADEVEVCSELGGGRGVFQAPTATLVPTVKRQSDLRLVSEGKTPVVRVLDLRNWLLPEDASEPDRSNREPMPASLAEYVRRAANFRLPSGKLVPELSAVAPNVRRDARGVVRHWYMLPDFAPRHRPLAFIPRVVSDEPWTEENPRGELLIDANFSTFWSVRPQWSGSALKALLNSTWVRALIEASGTPLGGGALKLEAVNLRQLPMPPLTIDDQARLGTLGAKLKRQDTAVLAEVDAIVLRALGIADTSESVSSVARTLAKVGQRLRGQRQRTEA